MDQTINPGNTYLNRGGQMIPASFFTNRPPVQGGFAMQLTNTGVPGRMIPMTRQALPVDLQRQMTINRPVQYRLINTPHSSEVMRQGPLNIINPQAPIEQQMMNRGGYQITRLL